MAKKRRPKPKAAKRSYRSKRKAWIIQFEGELKSIMREAAKVGAAEAIEHCANFWSVSDGYKKYINHQITTYAEVLMAAVKTALREELQRRDNLARRDAIDRGYKRAHRKPKP